MTLSLSRVLADAWAQWRRDRDLLLRIAAPFLFLPSLALQLLLPLPEPPEGADLVAAIRFQGEQVSAHAGGYLLALAMTQFGLVALLMLYCDPASSDVRSTLKRAAILWPRYVLVSLLIALPELVGLTAFVLPGLVVLARTMLAGPLLVAAQPLGAAAAIGRSIRMTAGQTLPLLALAVMCWGGQFLARAPFAELDRYLRTLHAPNPVALTVIDSAAAGIDMLAGIAGVLLSVSAYRLLSSRGT